MGQESDLEGNGKQGSGRETLKGWCQGGAEGEVMVPGEKRQKILGMLTAYHIVRTQ